MKLNIRGICYLLTMPLLAATAARADKIVLKNGKTIVAYSAAEVGDKVRYETSAGQMSLPKSIVDHIERGGLLPMSESPAAAAERLNIALPEMQPTGNSAEIDKAAVHDGGIDRGYIARVGGGSTRR